MRNKAMLATLAGLSVWLVGGQARAYTPQPWMYATNLTVELETLTPVGSSNFAEELHFINGTSVVPVTVDFAGSGNDYVGTTSGIELAKLQALVPVGNRLYWDDVRLTKVPGAPDLQIRILAVYISYGDRADGLPVFWWTEDFQIGYETNTALTDASPELVIDQRRGRRMGALAELGFSPRLFDATLPVFQAMVFDTGKSGSDNDPGAINPKYGDDESMCSETVSWYYYDQGVTVVNSTTGDVEDFQDMYVHLLMADAFQGAERFYCYDSFADEWLLKLPNGSLDSSQPYVPRPGDYLNRGNVTPGIGDGHAMMFASWDRTANVVHALDGPTPVGYIHVDLGEINREWCVGRLPDHDDEGRLGEACLFGAEQVVVTSRTDVLATTASNGSVWLEPDATVEGSVQAGGDLFVADRSSIGGTVDTTGTVHLGNDTFVGGRIREGVPLAAHGVPVEDVTPGTGFVEVAPHTGCALTLPPGAYGDVAVRSGCVLWLLEGDYQLASLDLGPDTELVVEGEVTVRSENSFQFGDRAMVSTASSFSSLLVYTNQPWSARIGTDSYFVGEIVAPHAELNVASRATFEGCARAKRIRVEPDTYIAAPPGYY